MTLVEFLTARLDEDERAADEAYGMPINPAGQAVEHYTRHDPARVLREVEAKRKIVEEARLVGEAAFPPATDRTDATQFAEDRWRVLRSVMAILASAYADHPDYQEAWRV